jgi:hypothetical protein
MPGTEVLERKKTVRIPEINEWQYLSDGVYASYDGYHIILVTTTGEQPEDATNRIALDPHGWSGLKLFVETIGP